MVDVNRDAVAGRLIDEAARLLAEFGSGSLSLRKVAAAAGTSTMAVYTRFGSKEQLLAAMHREGFRRLGETLHQAATAADGDLLAVGRAYRKAALDSPALYALMFGPPPRELQLSDADTQAAAATFRELTIGVAAAVAAGVLRGEANDIAVHLWAVAHGMVSLELTGRLPLPPEQAAAAFDKALQRAAAPFLA